MARLLTKMELSIVDIFYAKGDSISLFILHEEQATQEHLETYLKQKYSYDVKNQYKLFMETSTYRDCRNENCINTLEIHQDNGICNKEEKIPMKVFQLSDLCSKMHSITLTPWWLDGEEKSECLKFKTANVISYLIEYLGLAEDGEEFKVRGHCNCSEVVTPEERGDANVNDVMSMVVDEEDFENSSNTEVETYDGDECSFENSVANTTQVFIQNRTIINNSVIVSSDSFPSSSYYTPQSPTHIPADDAVDERDPANTQAVDSVQGTTSMPFEDLDLRSIRIDCKAYKDRRIFKIHPAELRLVMNLESCVCERCGRYINVSLNIQDSFRAKTKLKFHEES